MTMKEYEENSGNNWKVGGKFIFAGASYGEEHTEAKT